MMTLLTFYVSSFYGLVDILSGTELNMGQREIGEHINTKLESWVSLTLLVATAKQSCELLLKVYHLDTSSSQNINTRFLDHRFDIGL